LKEEMALSFQIPVGFSGDTDLLAIPLDTRDLKTGTLHIGQLRDRVLSVAAAKFLDQIMLVLETEFPDEANQSSA